MHRSFVREEPCICTCLGLYSTSRCQPTVGAKKRVHFFRNIRSLPQIIEGPQDGLKKNIILILGTLKKYPSFWETLSPNFWEALSPKSYVPVIYLENPHILLKGTPYSRETFIPHLKVKAGCKGLQDGLGFREEGSRVQGLRFRV